MQMVFTFMYIINLYSIFPQVGDFGLAREYGSPLKPYTSVVVTLWYRSPELLLCCKEYSHQIDMWSVGCIFAEFLAMSPLFPGKSEVDQLNRIFQVFSHTNEELSALLTHFVH